MESDVVMWRPDPKKETHLKNFRNRVNHKFGLKMETYQELHAWSVDEYPSFWEEVWQYCEVVHSQSHTQVVDRSLRMDRLPSWFQGARLNYAQNLLRFRDQRTAVYFAAEKQSGIAQYTFAQLYQEVAKMAAALRVVGVEKGVRVAGYLPNCPEALVAMLATAAIGAVWTSTSPDFGVGGVLDRFSQIQPEILFSVNAVVYNGKVHNHLGKLASVVRGLQEVKKVVVINYCGEEEKMDLSSIPNSVTLSEFLKQGLRNNGTVPELEFEQVTFNHPLFIMYSSGTTGPPKCMVHSVGGTLLKHLEEHVIQSNLHRSDVMIYYTTTGWMMWNWMVSALAVGCAIVLFDGSPLMPTPNVLWDLVDRLGITVLGTGAKWLSVVEEKGLRPRETHNLCTLHTILSTGSPLKPQTYDYVYSHIKKDVLLASISGGTDIIACFMGQNTEVPVVRGEIQSFHLGCAMSCWEEDGCEVWGHPGELVCTRPFPSMPTHFWNDPEGILYTKAYFAKFPGVWAHGDYCQLSPTTGGILMLGRSDGTLNPNGVRFGSAEIYNIVEEFEEVEDSLCVAQRNKEGEERVVLFLKLSQGQKLEFGLLQKIKTSIRTLLSARHVPALILEIPEIPYTVSGKKVEVAVRKLIAGEEVKNAGSLANPECLRFYKNLPEVQVW